MCLLSVVQTFTFINCHRHRFDIICLFALQVYGVNTSWISHQFHTSSSLDQGNKVLFLSHALKEKNMESTDSDEHRLIIDCPKSDDTGSSQAVSAEETESTKSGPKTKESINEVSGKSSDSAAQSGTSNRANERTDEKASKVLLQCLRDGTFVCNPCVFKTASESAFRAHIEPHAFDCLYQCHHCHSLCHDQSAVDDHIKNDHPEKNFFFGCLISPSSSEIVESLKSKSRGDQVNEIQQSGKSSSAPLKGHNEVTKGGDDVVEEDDDPDVVITGESQIIPISDNFMVMKHGERISKGNSPNHVESESFKTRLQCFFKNGMYVCKSCPGTETTQYYPFANHVYGHIHTKKENRKSDTHCPFCKTISAEPLSCTLVKNLMELLQKQKLLEQETGHREIVPPVPVGIPQPAPKSPANIAVPFPVIITPNQANPSATSASEILKKHGGFSTNMSSKNMTNGQTVVVPSQPGTKGIIPVQPGIPNQRPILPKVALHMPDVTGNTAPLYGSPRVSTAPIGSRMVTGPETRKVDSPAPTLPKVTSPIVIEPDSPDEPLNVPNPKKPEVAVGTPMPATSNSGLKVRKIPYSDAEDPNSDVSKLLVKCYYDKVADEFCCGIHFQCSAGKPKQFRIHLWHEVHPKARCNHCPPDISFNKFAHCPIINQLMKHLQEAKAKATKNSHPHAVRESNAGTDSEKLSDPGTPSSQHSSDVDLSSNHSESGRVKNPSRSKEISIPSKPHRQASTDHPAIEVDDSVLHVSPELKESGRNSAELEPQSKSVEHGQERPIRYETISIPDQEPKCDNNIQSDNIEEKSNTQVAEHINNASDGVGNDQTHLDLPEENSPVPSCIITNVTSTEPPCIISNVTSGALWTEGSLSGLTVQATEKEELEETNGDVKVDQRDGKYSLFCISAYIFL